MNNKNLFYRTTPSEILDYARYMGFNLEEDKDLLWIAREGLRAPLPK